MVNKIPGFTRMNISIKDENYEVLRRLSFEGKKPMSTIIDEILTAEFIKSIKEENQNG
jgi:hypothetical protein